ncbi:MAG: hypothetical protein [Inoviridae sp.]|nr:MAG: hypothetical protein [Inoviridae sp.]
MKVMITRVERVLKSGLSKTGNAYSLDFTNIFVSVPLNDADAFGSKEMTYQYGSAANFDKLVSLRGSLPCSVDVELGVEMDNYGNPKTVVTDVKLPAVTSINK